MSPGDSRIGRASFAFVASDEDAGERLDVIVARNAGLSRSVAARLIDGGDVTVNGAGASRSARVQEGARVSVLLPPQPEAPQPEDIPLRVVYEDEHLLVISKPAGLVVHPAAGHVGGTLVNALLARGTAAGGAPERPGIVHRLDAGTSGLMVVAKTEEAHDRLVRMMAGREVRRVYLALVEGVPATETGTVDAPIGRSGRHRKKMDVVAGGKPAVSHYSVLERFDDAALLEVRPETGRTHQIRVHLRALGHPVAGDAVYGRDRRLAARLGLERPFLHAARLSFRHPLSAAAVELEDPLPPDLEDVLRSLRSGGGTGT